MAESEKELRSLLMGVKEESETDEKMLAPWKKSYDKPRQYLKKQRQHFVCKGPYSQNCGFSSSHVWM